METIYNKNEDVHLRSNASSNILLELSEPVITNIIPYDETSEKCCPPMPCLTPQKSVQSSDDIPIDHKEWLITDLQTGKKRSPRQSEFLQLLLGNSRYSSSITWLDQSRGLFEILQPNRVVALWQRIKNRQTSGQMTYDKFARALRCYYKTKLMKKTNKKHTFCFN